MASINLAGFLVDPTGEFAVGDQIRFTHKSTTGDTIKNARSVLIIPPGGAYDIDLEFGNILVEYLDVKDVNYKNLGIVTVNGDSTAVTLPELLLAIVPPTDEQLLEFQNILAEAEALVAVFATTEGAENVNTNSNNSVQTELDGLTAGQSGGLIVFTTKALLDAFTPSGSPQEESSYKVTNDDITNDNNGYYHWNGAIFVKDFDLAIGVVEDGNPDAVSGGTVFDAIKGTRIFVGTDLDTLLEENDYFKIGSGDIDPADHYPPDEVAGSMEVRGLGASIYQVYTTFTGRNVWKRTLSGSGFNPWDLISAGEVIPQNFQAIVEWEGLTGAVMSYDPVTYNVTLVGTLLCAYENSANRILMSDLDVTLSGNFDICFLDLVALGDVDTINSGNIASYIKVGNYSNGSYIPALGKLPLFKRDLATQEILPCQGFVGLTPTLVANANAYYELNGSIFTAYTKINDDLYVGFAVRHEVNTDPIIFIDYWRLALGSFYTLTEGAMVATGDEAIVEGESEFVFAQNNDKDDFTGGVHGDEQVTDIKFLINGLLISIASDIPLTSCDTIEYIEKSTMHETAEGGVPIPGHPVIADHIKRTSFPDGGYRTYNKVTWQYTGDLVILYGGISSISKDTATSVMIDDDYEYLAMVGDDGEKFNSLIGREMIGENSSTGLTVNATSRSLDPAFDTGVKFFIGDRVTDSKYYRRNISNGSVTIGDVMEFEFMLTFNVS